MLHVSQRVLSLLKNPIWKLYFLNFVLPKFTKLNVMFQRSKYSVHVLHSGLNSIYIEFLSCYLTEAYWENVPLKDVNPASKLNFLPLSSMYMAPRLLYVSLMKNTSKEQQMFSIFLNACRNSILKLLLRYENAF
jgi:hypothetical protein